MSRAAIGPAGRMLAERDAESAKQRADAGADQWEEGERPLGKRWRHRDRGTGRTVRKPMLPAIGPHQGARWFVTPLTKARVDAWNQPSRARRVH